MLNEMQFQVLRYAEIYEKKTPMELCLLEPEC